MQRDLFDGNTFYYDFVADHWTLGDLRDTLKEGDTLEAEGKTWKIVERSDIAQCFTIIEVNDEQV